DASQGNITRPSCSAAVLSFVSAQANWSSDALPDFKLSAAAKYNTSPPLNACVHTRRTANS
ncbi:MAG: hypothetical protein NZ739_10880, partial [Verrucomicrobiae bacterium]|nr:hypothetical protein [Verrucomicrobiae bacterium]